VLRQACRPPPAPPPEELLPHPMAASESNKERTAETCHFCQFIEPIAFPLVDAVIHSIELHPTRAISARVNTWLRLPILVKGFTHPRNQGSARRLQSDSATEPDRRYHPARFDPGRCRRFWVQLPGVAQGIAKEQDRCHFPSWRRANSSIEFASFTSSTVIPPASWVARSMRTLFQTLNHSG